MKTIAPNNIDGSRPLNVKNSQQEQLQVGSVVLKKKKKLPEPLPHQRHHMLCIK